MASIVKNEKGFKVIKIDRDELQQAVGSPGICDFCSNTPKEGYYIAVLNSWYCPVCYQERIKHATYHKEDKPIEERNYDYMTEKLENIRNR